MHGIDRLLAGRVGGRNSRFAVRWRGEAPDGSGYILGLFRMVGIHLTDEIAFAAMRCIFEVVWVLSASV